jgi:hypothetical protein
MTRFIAFFAVATLLGGCATISTATKDDADVVSGLPVEGATKRSDKAHVKAATSLGFCAREDVERPVQLRAGDIRACYEEQLKHRPNLSGRVEATWTIGKDGRASKVVTTGLKEVGACVATVIKSIRFRPPEIGCELISQYPFVFELG